MMLLVWLEEEELLEPIPELKELLFALLALLPLLIPLVPPPAAVELPTLGLVFKA